MPYSYPPKYALKEDTRLISERIDALTENTILMKEDTTLISKRVESLETWKPDSSSAAIDAVVDKAPSAQNAESAPLVMQKAAVTYDTDKITFTAKAAGAAGNGITVEASCRLSATLGSGATEITLIGEDGLYAYSEVPLVSVQIVQAATEATLLVSNAEGVITVSLPADGNNAPISTTMDEVLRIILDEMLSTNALNGVIAGVTPGEGYDQNAKCVVSGVVPFKAAQNTVEGDYDTVMILLAYDGTNFHDWDSVVAEVNEDVNSTLVTASAGAQGFAGQFKAITTEGGVDSRLCKAGQILYRTEGIIVCVEDTTAAETDTSKYMFFAKDAE
jgi:hypothetical protein